MVTTLGPVVESVFALDLYGRKVGGVFDEWRKQVRVRLGPRVDGVEKLLRERRPLPELLWLMRQPMVPADTRDKAVQARQRTAAVVFGFCQVAVAPFWSRLRGHLEAERDAHARIAITRGVDWLLSSLHPKLRWKSPVLEISGEPEGDLYLRGRGLLLSPALFLSRSTCVVFDNEHHTGGHVLAFSTPPNAAMMVNPLGIEEHDPQALGALVGHTRAAALLLLSDSCTTGELSVRLGISLAGASKHATVLRQAGLISTARYRNNALHTLTSLGMALLRKPGVVSMNSLGRRS